MSYDDRSISSGAFAKASMHRRSARALLQQSTVSRYRGQRGGENCHSRKQYLCSREHKQAIYVLQGAQSSSICAPRSTNNRFLCSRGHNLSAEGSCVASLRTPAREEEQDARAQTSVHTRIHTRSRHRRQARPSCCGNAVLGSAKMRAKQAALCATPLQCPAPRSGTRRSPHRARTPCEVCAAQQISCHPHSARGHSARALSRCS